MLLNGYHPVSLQAPFPAFTIICALIGLNKGVAFPKRKVQIVPDAQLDLLL